MFDSILMRTTKPTLHFIAQHNANKTKKELLQERRAALISATRACRLRYTRVESVANLNAALRCFKICGKHKIHSRISMVAKASHRVFSCL